MFEAINVNRYFLTFTVEKKLPKHLFAFISSFCHSIIEASKAANHLTDKENCHCIKIGNKSCWKELLYKDASFIVLKIMATNYLIAITFDLEFFIQLIQSFSSSSSYFDLNDLLRDSLFSGLMTWRAHFKKI